MHVRDVMEEDIVIIKKGMTYPEVMRVFRKHKISGAPVVDESGKLIGVVSEKDLLRILYPFYESYYLNPVQYSDHEEREKKAADIKGHRVEIFMSRELHTVTPDMPIMRAGAIMLSRNVHRLPVVEGEKIVGIVTRGAIYEKIMEMNYGDLLDEEG